MFRRILLPTDGSHAAGHAAEVIACRLSDQPDAYVMCAVAITPTDPDETELDVRIVEAQNEHIRERAARIMREAAGVFRRVGVAYDTKVLKGKPISAAIAREAEAGGYAARAMGSQFTARSWPTSPVGVYADRRCDWDW